MASSTWYPRYTRVSSPSYSSGGGSSSYGHHYQSRYFPTESGHHQAHTTVSYGIILFCRDQLHPNDLSRARVLLGQRRDSISYWEFIKNSLPKGSMTTMHIKLMSDEERQRCLQYHDADDFDTLWDDFWVFEENSMWTTHRERCRASFHENVAENRALFEQCQSTLPDADRDICHENNWHFPKGRPQTHEAELQCALREFEEETCISKHQVRVLDRQKTLQELYMGTNCKMYRTVYFLSESTATAGHSGQEAEPALEDSPLLPLGRAARPALVHVRRGAPPDTDHHAAEQRARSSAGLARQDARHHRAVLHAARRATVCLSHAAAAKHGARRGAREGERQPVGGASAGRQRRGKRKSTWR